MRIPFLKPLVAVPVLVCLHASATCPEVAAGDLDGSSPSFRHPAAHRVGGAHGERLRLLSAEDWSGIRAAHEAGRYAARRTAGGYDASNPRQAWGLRFDGRGVLVRSDSGRWMWGLRLEGYGFEEGTSSVTKPAEVKAIDGRVSYDWDEVLTEWYVNDARGLEHGYTLRERPSLGRGGGPLTIDLAILGELRSELQEDGCGVRFLDESGAVVLVYSGLLVVDADGRQLDARFELTTLGLRLSVEEGRARYPITIDPLVQRAYLKASNANAGDTFARSIAISGNTVVVGASGERSRATGVNGNEADNGAFNAGAAYVFVRSGGAWSQEAYLKASNTDAQDQFGAAVAISGDTIVVGSPNEDSGAVGVNGNQADNGVTAAGAAYVFVRNGGVWSQQAYLKASNTGGGDIFGNTVSISGDTVVIGALQEDSGAVGVNGDQSDNSASDAGAAYVFVRNGGVWGQQAYLKASNAGAGDDFGVRVVASGDTIAVGAFQEASGASGVNGNGADNSAGGAGAAYVFVRNGGVWSQEAYLKASNTSAGDGFGLALSLAGDSIVVGAFLEDSGASGVNGNQADETASGAGAAYVFTRSGSAWSQEAYLKASNTDGGDQFGVRVSISGERIVVGANGEDSAARGIGGDQTDNSAPNAGAAYVFVRSGKTWRQGAYIKASNADAGDEFGGSMSILDETMVIGSVLEDSSATGVNGDESNNAAGSAGAVYVFEVLPKIRPTVGAPHPAGTQLASTVAPSIGSDATGIPLALDLMRRSPGGPAFLRIAGPSCASVLLRVGARRPVGAGAWWSTPDVQWFLTLDEQGFLELPLGQSANPLEETRLFGQVALLDLEGPRPVEPGPVVELTIVPWAMGEPGQRLSQSFPVSAGSRTTSISTATPFAPLSGSSTRNGVR